MSPYPEGVKEFKCLEVSFMSEGTMGWDIGRRISAAGAVLHSLCCTVATKRELSQKVWFVLSLTYGHEGWVMTERMRLGIQATEMGFLGRTASIFLRDRVRSSVICQEFRVEPLFLCAERIQLRWFGHLVSGKDASWLPPHGGVPGTSCWEEALGQSQSQAERFYLCTGLGMLWDPPELSYVAREREVLGSLLKLLLPQPNHG